MIRLLPIITIWKMEHKPKAPITKSLQHAFRYGIIGTSYA